MKVIRPKYKHTQLFLAYDENLTAIKIDDEISERKLITRSIPQDSVSSLVCGRLYQNTHTTKFIAALWTISIGAMSLNI